MNYLYPLPKPVDLSGYVKTADLPKPLVIRTNTAPPDGDWLIALDVRDDWTAKKRTTRIWGQIQPGTAKPLVLLEDLLTLPTHADAVVQSDGSYKTDISDLKLTYRNTLTPQNEAILTMGFPAGNVTRVDVEGQDANGVALELGGQAIAPTATSFSLNSFMGNALVTQILYKFTMGESVVEYRVPLIR